MIQNQNLGPLELPLWLFLVFLAMLASPSAFSILNGLVRGMSTP
jgi:hypothetical protein